jgi:hypothetical protein
MHLPHDNITGASCDVIGDGDRGLQMTRRRQCDIKVASCKTEPRPVSRRKVFTIKQINDSVLSTLTGCVKPTSIDGLAVGLEWEGFWGVDSTILVNNARYKLARIFHL